MSQKLPVGVPKNNWTEKPPKVLAEIQLKLVTIGWCATSVKDNCLNFLSESFEKSYFNGYLQMTTYKTQTQPLSLQLANLKKSKSFMNIFEVFNYFPGTLSTYTEQLFLSYNRVFSRYKCTLPEMSIRSANLL